MNTYASEINTTPLIDVLLVLLVFLLLSVPPLMHFVGMTLPTSPSKSTTPRTIDVDIDFDGRVYWNGRLAADIPALESWFRDASGADSKTLVRVYPDRTARFERVAQVLAAAQRAHVDNLWLAPGS